MDQVAFSVVVTADHRSREDFVQIVALIEEMGADHTAIGMATLSFTMPRKAFEDRFLRRAPGGAVPETAMEPVVPLPLKGLVEHISVSPRHMHFSAARGAAHKRGHEEE